MPRLLLYLLMAIANLVAKAMRSENPFAKRPQHGQGSDQGQTEPNLETWI